MSSSTNSLSTDLPPPFPSLTKRWHNTTYPSISPTLPALSTTNRSILITGGGTGIGAAIARSFAAAGSRSIALLGRTPKTLQATAAALQTEFPGITVLPQVADVTSRESVDAAFEAVGRVFGTIDVCVSNAAQGGAKPVAELEPVELLQTLNANVVSGLIVAQAFLRQAGKGACLLHTSSGLAHINPILGPVGAYSASKAAATKLFEYIAKEHPDVFVANVQPGVVWTDLSQASGNGMDQDDPSLAGDFFVWLASPEASFLRGKFVWVNWDVDELKARKEEIVAGDLLELGAHGVSMDGWNPEHFAARLRKH